MTTYRACHDCNRPLRPTGTTAEQHPGTVSNQGRGLCNTDWHTRNKEGTLHQVPEYTRPRATHCAGPCGRPLRTRRTPAADAPGRVLHKANGLCGTCLYQSRKPDTTLTPEEEERIEKLRAAQIGFHLAWRRRKGLDITAPIDLHQIAMGLAA